MTTNYDPIAEQYKRSKQQPWRAFVECFTLMYLIGDLREMAVLDVACGEGFYTRMIRERGAARVTGVDLSQGMIDLARSQEARHEIGIDYVVGDARELSGTGSSTWPWPPICSTTPAIVMNFSRCATGSLAR